MSPSKIRRALGAMKDQTSIGLAKVGSSASLSDLDVAIVKATRHVEEPAEEKHIREILSLTCYSRVFISACVNTLSKRLSKTRNWTVALKTLVLVQRLLADGDPAYEQEIFFSTRRGTRFLNLSDFRDASSGPGAWDYSAFVRTYALYLDERLEYRMQSRRGRKSAFGVEEEDDDATTTIAAAAVTQHQQQMTTAVVVRATPVREMRTDQVFSRAHHLQQLLERFLACRPTGEARSNRVVIVALYPSVKESFQLYYELTESMGVLIDRFVEMQVSDCTKVLDLFSRVGKQFEELEQFYLWCKSTGIARSSEYPELEKITPKKLLVMEDFIRDKSNITRSSAHHVAAAVEEEEPRSDGDIRVVEHKDDDDEDVLNGVRALPAPETKLLVVVVEEEQQNLTGDLLGLGDSTMTAEDHGDKLALALFDGPASQPKWEAFPDENSPAPATTTDWETALVETASGIGLQTTHPGGGFDPLTLEGMYRKDPLTSGAGGDPFAASVGVAPPSYVQISEMERKQRMMAEEQMMWQQYASDGMHGQLGMGRIQHARPYHHLGFGQGYTSSY